MTHLLRLGPLVLGEELVLVTALNSTADSVDTFVGLGGRETLEGLLGNGVLLLEEIIESVTSGTNGQQQSGYFSVTINGIN